MPFVRCVVPRQVYRICYGDDPLAPLPLELYIDKNRKPNRWDPHDYSYRVLYTADTFENAFKEIIADLIPRREALAILSTIDVEPGDETEVDVPEAIYKFLEERSAATLIAPEAFVVRIDEAQSRQMVAEALEMDRTPKIGDFIGSEIDLPRNASKVVRDDKEFGIACSSAITPGSVNFSFFEAGSYSGKWMLDFVPHGVRPSLEESLYLRLAMEDFGF
jgi:hypothetical protein